MSPSQQTKGAVREGLTQAGTPSDQPELSAASLAPATRTPEERAQRKAALLEQLRAAQAEGAKIDLVVKGLSYGETGLRTIRDAAVTTGTAAAYAVGGNVGSAAFQATVGTASRAAEQLGNIAIGNKGVSDGLADLKADAAQQLTGAAVTLVGGKVGSAIAGRISANLSGYAQSFISTQIQAAANTVAGTTAELGQKIAAGEELTASDLAGAARRAVVGQVAAAAGHHGSLKLEAARSTVERAAVRATQGVADGTLNGVNSYLETGSVDLSQLAASAAGVAPAKAAKPGLTTEPAAAPRSTTGPATEVASRNPAAQQPPAQESSATRPQTHPTPAESKAASKPADQQLDTGSDGVTTAGQHPLPQPQLPRVIGRASQPLALNLSQLESGDRAHCARILTLAERQNEFLNKVVRSEVNADPSLQRAEAIYVDIHAQIPRDQGRVRMISVEQLKEAIQVGSLPTGSDFAMAGEGARVGHNSRFIAVICNQESAVKFCKGQAGSSELNMQPIPLKDLTLVIPAVPRLEPVELARN